MTVRDFERETETMRPMLLQMARGYLGCAEDAEDIVQDAFEKLCDMVGTLRSPLAPLAKVLVRNFSIDRIRRRHPTVSVDNVALAAPSVSSVYGTVSDRMMDIIDTLPAAQQVVLRLRHIDGMEFSEIARLTGSSEESVRKMLSRARIAVRKHFLNDKDDED